jgi:hypothetical protein
VHVTCTCACSNMFGATGAISRDRDRGDRGGFHPTTTKIVQ